MAVQHTSLFSDAVSKPIPVPKRVMIALWRLATNIEFRSLACMFGVGESTACQVTLEFVHAVLRHLMPIYVKFPHGDQLLRVLHGFKNQRGMPQCGGAIDGTHIPIVAPSDHHTDYFNRKGWHSIVMQAVVDHEGKFTDVISGWPGSVHDARVLTESGLFKRGTSGTLFPDLKEDISGCQVPIYLIGDPAYPLLSWLMKGYPQAALGDPQKFFTFKLSSARMVVEKAFGRFKGRWRCLLKRFDGNLEYVNYVIGACVTLHNICEMFKEDFREEWLDEVTAECEHPQPHHMGREEQNNRQNARKIQEALMTYMNRNQV